MKLVVIIPAYNESGSIVNVIKSIPRQIEGINSLKIYLLDDGSTDNTAEMARKAGAEKIIINKKNLGLARTFQKGIISALEDGAEIIVNIDADNQYLGSDIPILINPILKKQADIVIGDRQVRSLDFMPWGNKYGNLLGSWVLRKLTKAEVKDASSGFRAFARESALRLHVLYKHTYTHETIIQAIYHNLKIVEVPITFNPRYKGQSRLISNLFTHVKNSSLIIIRTILMYRPLRTLFYLGIAIMLPGIIIGLRFLYFYFYINGSGKIQSLILATMLIIIGFLVIVLGFVGDLIANNRKINEELLYYQKKQQFFPHEENI